jgi:orotate phosphoribosyltransferase
MSYKEIKTLMDSIDYHIEEIEKAAKKQGYDMVSVVNDDELVFRLIKRIKLKC